MKNEKYIREDFICTNLGIDRKHFKKLRDTNRIKRNVHYIKQQNRILYSALGIKALQKLLNVSINVDDESSKKEQTPLLKQDFPLMLPEPKEAKEQNTYKYFVAQIPKNTRILICKKALIDKENVVVHVRDNKLFVPGMIISVIRLGDRLEFDGKLPRRKGVF